MSESGKVSETRVGRVTEEYKASDPMPPSLSQNSKKRKRDPEDSTLDAMNPQSQIPVQSTVLSSFYTALHEDGSEIRLVRLLPGKGSDPIRCWLDGVRLNKEHTPRYKALSYTWGAPGATRVIELSGTDLTITENLWQALYHLRSRDYEQSFWIDAVCMYSHQTRIKSRRNLRGLVSVSDREMCGPRFEK